MCSAGFLFCQHCCFCTSVYSIFITPWREFHRYWCFGSSFESDSVRLETQVTVAFALVRAILATVLTVCADIGSKERSVNTSNIIFQSVSVLFLFLAISTATIITKMLNHLNKDGFFVTRGLSEKSLWCWENPQRNCQLICVGLASLTSVTTERNAQRVQRSWHRINKQ